MEALPIDPTEEDDDEARREARDRLFDLLSRFHVGTLVTRSADGRLRGRPMTVGFIDSSAEEIGFLIARDSPAVREVTEDPSATVVFQNARHQISWVGRAQIEDERYRITRAWTPDMLSWFPEGPDDPDLVLLVVRAELAEYWSSSIAADTLRAIERATGTTTRRSKPSAARQGLVVFDLDPGPSGW